MPSLRAFTALVLGLLFLQLTLLGDRASCRSLMASHPGGGMAAMQMAAPLDAGPASHDACDAERAASACASMPSCAAAVGVPVSVAAVVAPPPSASALSEPVAVHSQPAAAPDAPPPRG